MKKAIVLCFILLTGCTGLTETEKRLFLGAAADRATVELIEAAAGSEHTELFQREQMRARAARVASYADAALLSLNNDVITVEAVYQAVVEAIDWESIPVQDRQLVRDLLDLVRDRLNAEIAERVDLSENQRISVRYVVERIKGAADRYR